MRIWMLNHYATPPDRPGGTRHYDFGRAFAARGHDVTIFASGFNHLTRREERLPPGRSTMLTEIDAVRFVWLRTTAYTRNDHRRVLGMISYALRVLRIQHRYPAPDVVVGSSVHLLAVVAAWVIARLRRAAFVFEVRDLWPQTLIDLGAISSGGPPARLLRALELFLYRRADLVVCLLPRASDYVVGRGVPVEKVVYIPNGAPQLPGDGVTRCEDTLLLLKRVAELKQRGIRVVGYTGAHGLANDVEVLVAAAGVLRQLGVNNLVILLVGEGPSKSACQREAARRGLDNVLFADPVPKSEIPAVLRAMDVTVFPLRDTPVFRFGLSSNKLFDYLASGRPTVFAAGVPDNPIRAAGSGVCVPPGDPVRLAEALVELVTLPLAAREDLGAMGQRYVREHHDVARLADRFLAALARPR
jgi:glycosyltransferase involved in cell wall biosynthesis